MKTFILGALALAATATIPAAAFAATFAYVDQAGDVRTVTADNAQAALLTAPSIDEHSGVMIIDSADDAGIIGNNVSGV